MNRPAAVYALVLVVLGTLLGFALIGISVARESELHLPHIWVPRLLAVASGFLIVAVLYRIIRRFLG